jgi:pyruvate,water dikinase
LTVRLHPMFERPALVPTFVLSLDDRDAADLARAGGKGAALARMQVAGLPVPHGFVVTTDAYASHIQENALEPTLAKTLAAIDFDDPQDIDRKTAAIRAFIVAAPVPDAIREAILSRYRALDRDAFVAVRSSGTAEDLADASFAGMHDTYLDVRGDEQVIVNVRRCWASMWTARATAYRHRKGYTHRDQRLAVVVLRMVAADAAGVMFTANPMTTTVDEYVINAAWGLGEGIVSGQVTPDEFVADRDTRCVKRATIGEKAVRIVRDDRNGGTIAVANAADDRARPALTDAQIAELVELGRRVVDYFDGWPQDVEWALEDGRFFILQAREITGVDFCWDEDVDAHGVLPRLRDDAVLSRARADTVWTGRITPLFYSLRSEARTLATPRMYRLWAGDREAQARWGQPGAPVGALRWYKYHRGAVYFNSEVEYRNFLEVVPPRLRNRALCEWTPPHWLDDFAKRPGGWRRLLRVYARLWRYRPQFSVSRVLSTLRAQIRANENGLGMSAEAIRGLDDAALGRYVQTTIENQAKWVTDIANAFYLHSPFMSSCFLWMFEHWYKGEDRGLYGDLVTGLPEQTYTVKQNDALWSLAETIRASAPLRALFDANPGAAFFAEAARHPCGVAFTEKYRGFLDEFGHRGQADRDIWYDRRSEDPGIDYRALALLLQAEGRKAATDERAIVARREAATRTVQASIRAQRFGWLKARSFAFVQKFMLDFYVFRDDSRHHTDRNTFAKKRAVVEVGRRLFERGVLERPDDFYYLSKNELLALLDDPTKRLRLMRAKAAARRRNCERYRKEWMPPMYIRGNGTVFTEPAARAAASDDRTRLQGKGMSRGSATGRARVLATLDELGRLERGDILVARGTDPGWTPAFIVLSGLVLETGGTLSHGACLAREYGVPAVQLADAMSRIADGTMVRVDGDTGEVAILAQSRDAPVALRP